MRLISRSPKPSSGGPSSPNVRPSRPLLPLMLALLSSTFIGIETASAAQSLPARPTLSPSGALVGRVLDASGAVVPNAAIIVRSPGGQVATTTTDEGGRFSFASLPEGSTELTVDRSGFQAKVHQVRIIPADRTQVDITLEVSGLSEAVQVLPERLVGSAEAAARVPGSLDILDLTELQHSRVLTTAEVLRKAPGVYVRDEEGFALRPNIGIRGLNPTRASRVLLLEDGIPLTYAPYGDNASYYHPPIERFDRVELLKGSGQIAYGPMTVGGVINYVTPPPPGSPRGSATVSAGNRGYLNAQAGWGTTLGKTGLQIDVMRKTGDGARENVSTRLHDVNAKIVSRLSDRQVLTLRGSYYAEDSNVTYSGLREDEYRADPRQNPFRNDFFYLDRSGASVTHNFAISSAIALTTNLYTSNFSRDWWRQSSNSAQRPNDVSDPRCGGMQNLDTTCGNEGRLRRYVVWGIEPRLRVSSRFAGISNETDAGVRLHVEDQERRQENGDVPSARTGVLVENNERGNRAYSGFVQNRFTFGPWSVTPGVRVERVDYARTNRLLNVSGRTHLLEVIPGIGAAYSVSGRYTIFAGVHRGFTPPRTEDVINNTTGGVVELAPERSWNYEAGLRGRFRPGIRADAAFFRMDYENQVIPATLAGGVGAALTNAGRTLHQGVELSVRIDSAGLLGSPHNVYMRAAYTWLPMARFEGARFSSVPGFGSISVTGRRLPYAPEHLLTTGIGYTHVSGFDINAESVLIGDQYGDDLNSIAPSADGQRGLLPGYTLWNGAVNYPVPHATIFVAVKNIFDRTVIVDRTRGLLPSAPRTLQAGFKLRF